MGKTGKICQKPWLELWKIAKALQQPSKCLIKKKATKGQEGLGAFNFLLLDNPSTAWHWPSRWQPTFPVWAWDSRHRRADLVLKVLSSPLHSALPSPSPPLYCSPLPLLPPSTHLLSSPYLPCSSFLPCLFLLQVFKEITVNH